MFYKTLIGIFLCLILSNNLISQTNNKSTKVEKSDYSKAINYFKTGNYNKAIYEFEILLKTEPDNVSYHAFIGYAYLNSNINKQKAIEHFEIVVSAPNCDPFSYYDLGRSYMLDYQFDKAITNFEKFRIINKDNEKDNVTVATKRMIEMCKQAKELYTKKVNVKIENVGAIINSEFPDYNPYINEDENILFFTSKRVGNTGNYEDNDGFKTADVFISQFEEQNWAKPKRLASSINTYLIEESVGITSKGNDLLMYIYNENAMDDIFISSRKGKSYQRSDYLNINSKFEETSATISPDNKYIFFASKRPNGIGRKDLWYSIKLPDESWDTPINLGDIINTEFDEDFPQIAPDGKTLYFSSTGHFGMGGYDLFKTTWDTTNMTFTKPENLGYPINTPNDNKTISVSKSGRYGYIHDFREGGYGDLDIYRITFLDVPAPVISLNAKIYNKDSVEIYGARNIVIKNAQQKVNQIKNEIEKLKQKIIINEKSIEKISDTVAYTNKIVATQKIIKTSQEQLNKLTLKDLPIAEKKLSEANEELNVSISVIDTISKKNIISVTPDNISGEFTIPLKEGNYFLKVSSNKFPEWITKINILDKEPSLNPLILNIYIENKEIIKPKEKEISKTKQTKVKNKNTKK